jgi:LmbE family N-acetylglucosaminyl deacetylase
MHSHRLLSLSILLIALLAAIRLTAQEPFNVRPPDAAQLYRDIERLGVVGNVLYVAAHPDDENTRMISWFARQRLTRTAYLSLTRGDGGQNLIGPEISELLGVLRTQELLAARRIDGGEQWFTRANDFGYSKTAEETMAIWNKEAVLSDVVWAIRLFKPDVIINRFNAETSGSTHGHHTASAMLALEAFDLAGNPEAFPEQLRWVEPWQPRRIFFNTSWWFYGSQEAFDKADKSRMSQVDIGVYEPWSGYSNSEIAMRSRSMHRCQGFGSELYRGESPDYIDLLKGDLPDDKDDPLSGIDLSWSRVPGGLAIQEAIQSILSAYDFRAPGESLPGLIRLYKAMRDLSDHPWQAQKLQELQQIILACAGVFAEAKTGQPTVTPGDPLTYSVEITQRAGIPILLQSLEVAALNLDTTLALPLAINNPWKFTHSGTVRPDAGYTAPYWLLQSGEGGMYRVETQTLHGRPETPHPIAVQVTLFVEEMELRLELPLVHKQVDPAYGERYQPLYVLPPGTVTPVQPVALFPGADTREVEVRIRAGRDDFEGIVRIELPDGWHAEPTAHHVSIALQGDELTRHFSITPPAETAIDEARFVLECAGRSYPYALHEVRYDHIPHQAVLLPAMMRVAHVPLEGTGLEVGYIIGAGDQVPECLRNAGFGVTILEDSDLHIASLQRFDAVIAGVRAYNTREGLKYRQQALEEYIRNGGVYIVQYNTNRGLVTSPSPLPLVLSRQRVTDEDAQMQMLAPTHPALQHPNLIGPSDFEGWVQERGLYFPDKWDKAFTPLLAAADPGEQRSEGLLLVAPLDRGYYVYTGLSFFRQLPAGVPGAYRLMANLIALGKMERP